MYGSVGIIGKLTFGTTAVGKSIAHYHLPVLLKRFYGIFRGKEIPLGVGNGNMHPGDAPGEDALCGLLNLQVYPAALKTKGAVMLKGYFSAPDGFADGGNYAEICHHLETITDTKHEGIPFNEVLEFLETWG